MKLPKHINKYHIGLLIALVFIGSISGILIQRAGAQEAVRTITVIPPSESIPPLNPGEKWEGVLHVINQSTSPLIFKIDVKDFTVVDSIGTPNLLPPGVLDSRFAASSWIAVSPQTFTVQPGQRQDIDYYLQIPLGARPGGHYAAVSYTPINSTSEKGTGVAVRQEIGTLFYIAVKGPIKEQATVSKFFANNFQEYGPVNILTQITNFGDLHINPTGYIKVSDILGREKILPLDSHNIFPGGVARNYENSFSGLFIGRFKAELIATYGTKNNLPLTAVVYFWIFPWKLTIVVVLIVIAVILALLLYRKKKEGGKSDKTEPETKENSEEKKDGTLKEYHSPSSQ